MSSEIPTFDPGNLPEERLLRVQADTDFELLEQGLSPDKIAEIRAAIKEPARIWTEKRIKDGAGKND